MAMRTFTPLIALLLMAFKTQAVPFEGTAEEVLDHKQLGKDDQDMFISFRLDEGTALQYAGVRSHGSCFCRRGNCGFGERHIGYCRYQNIVYQLCCRQ